MAPAPVASRLARATLMVAMPLASVSAALPSGKLSFVKSPVTLITWFGMPTPLGSFIVTLSKVYPVASIEHVAMPPLV